MRSLCLAAALILVPPAVAQTTGPAAIEMPIPAADRAAVEDIIKRWEGAWNRKDPEAWAALFHEDATWILWTGAEWHGRPAILAGISGPFLTFYKGSTQLSTIREIRQLSPDVLVVRSRTTLTGDTRQPDAVIYGNKILVMTRRNGVWAILYGQNTRLNEAEAAKVAKQP